MRALRTAFAGRGRSLARSVLRRHRLATAWTLLLLLTWLALGVGTIQLLMGGIAILAGAFGMGILLLIGGLIAARLSMD